MIPRENFKKMPLRTNRIVTASAERGAARIPTGFRLKAQGCEERATLGQPSNIITTPTGLWQTT
jgi:hypothetical protein